MRDDDFQKLLGSVKQADAIIKGDAEASRTTTFDVPDVKAIRQSCGLNQVEFAAMISVPVKTVRNWEQKIRNPTGPAKALLMVALKNPDAVKKALDKTA